MSITNSNDIGNRTRNFLACSAVPQPTAPPRAPGRIHNSAYDMIILKKVFHNADIKHPVFIRASPHEYNAWYGEMNSDNHIRIRLLFFSAVTRIVNVFSWTVTSIKSKYSPSEVTSYFAREMYCVILQEP
jgi:hypothetical protein